VRSVENSLSKILSDAEAAVLNVLSNAATAGNYAEIDRARELAEKLRAMNQGLNRQSEVKKGSASPRAPVKKGRKRKTTAGKKNSYPKFEFRNGSLYKFGWSKKKSDEYVHRVPVAAVNLVSDVLQGFNGSADPVSSEHLIDSELLKGRVPSYQVYIVLAFLKARGIITSAGRDGFQLPMEIKSQVDEILREEAVPR
jgi:hypothetical protein